MRCCLSSFHSARSDVATVFVAASRGAGAGHRRQRGGQQHGSQERWCSETPLSESLSHGHEQRTALLSPRQQLSSDAASVEDWRAVHTPLLTSPPPPPLLSSPPPQCAPRAGGARPPSPPKAGFSSSFNTIADASSGVVFMEGYQTADGKRVCALRPNALAHPSHCALAPCALNASHSVVPQPRYDLPTHSRVYRCRRATVELPSSAFMVTT